MGAHHTWSQLFIEYLLFYDSFLSLWEDIQLTQSNIYSEIQPWFCLNQEFKQFLFPSNLKASRYIIKSDPQLVNKYESIIICFFMLLL